MAITLISLFSPLFITARYVPDTELSMCKHCIVGRARSRPLGREENQFLAESSKTRRDRAVGCLSEEFHKDLSAKGLKYSIVIPSSGEIMLLLFSQHFSTRYPSRVSLQSLSRAGQAGRRD